MTCKFFEDPAEIGVIMETDRFCTSADSDIGIFQHLNCSLDPDLQLIPVWRHAHLRFEHPDKPILGKVTHIGILFNVDRLVEGNMHLAEYLFDLLITSACDLLFL